MQVRLIKFAMAALLLASSCTGSSDGALADSVANVAVDPADPIAVPSATAGPADVPRQDEPVADSTPPRSPSGATIELLAEVGFNGVVAIADGGAVDIVPFGTADPRTQAPMDETTVFDIGSITKQFTGAAITALHMDGRLSVEDQLGDYLPALGADKADISLHQLLTHTAGLPAGLGHDYDPISRDEYVALVADTPLQSVPGERYAYSNVGYSLLAAVIEVLTADTYETYLRDRLFEPAGLIDTGYVRPDWSDNEITVGFVGDEIFGRPNEQVWSSDGPYWHLLGNGGLLSTADDMLRWLDALAGSAVLDESAKELLFGAHAAEGGGSSYGYGWSITDLAGHRLITHNGGNGVFFADLLHFPDEELTIFLATNSADSQHEDAAWAVASQLLGTDGAGVRSVDCPLIGPDEIAIMDAISEVPATPAGAAFAELVAVATASPGSLDDDAFTAFADSLIRPAMASDATDEAIRPQIESLQAEFDGYRIAHLVAHEDGRTFAISLLGGGEPLVFSATLSDTNPAHALCLEVSA